MIWATVITDASFSDTDKSAGWAAWVRIDGKADPIKHYSSFSCAIETSVKAEKLAAINGVWIAKKYGADAVLLQTDCMNVIHLLNGNTKKREPISEWNMWIEKSGLAGFPIRAKHVKGHTTKNDPRSYINRWCDKWAGKARKANL